MLPSRPIPTVVEVDKIAAINPPVLRNLQITQCYYELSAAFVERTGPAANWCTYATWASKQAGQTIRREDLMRSLEAVLKKEPAIEQVLAWIATLAHELGARQTKEQIRTSALISLISASANRASEAVSRGNKKVFEEIARQFARFISTCFNDATFNKERIEDFCRQLQSGPPPNGQQYLQQAFIRYYESFFEEDPKRQTELRLLANIEIGFHEQTRLQPEIAESLNAAAFVDPQQVKNRLLQILFPGTDYTSQFRSFFQRLFQRTRLLDKAIALLVAEGQHHLRRALTVHLMTLTLPPDSRLRLGQDLNAVFPADLQQPCHPDLVTMLARIDPTQNSLRQSGATDWAQLEERLHFIADLFRCYHKHEALFNAPFTPEQVIVLKEGKVPDGRL